MKAIDYLVRQRDAARSLSETENVDVQRQNYEFSARLCDELIGIVNVDTILNEAQAEFVGLTVGNVGYKFLPDHDVKYKETPTTCPFLLMQLAAYINSCK
jgi:hypothetical protein